MRKDIIPPCRFVENTNCPSECPLHDLNKIYVQTHRHHTTRNLEQTTEKLRKKPAGRVKGEAGDRAYDTLRMKCIQPSSSY